MAGGLQGELWGALQLPGGEGDGKAIGSSVMGLKGEKGGCWPSDAVHRFSLRMPNVRSLTLQSPRTRVSGQEVASPPGAEES